MGTFAFFDNQLTSLTLSSGVAAIPQSAFASNNLTTLIVPVGVTSIGNNAFGYNQLSSITLPEGVSALGTGAFRENRLTSISLPNSLTSITLNVFANNLLTSVSFGNALTNISQGAFEFNQLTSVVVPNTTTNISRLAFANQTPGMDSMVAYGLVQAADPAGWTQVREHLVYVRVYTDAVLPDGIAFNQSTLYGSNSFMTGGHLINPAELIAHFVDEDGTQLVDPYLVVGEFAPGDYIYDYYVTTGPQFASNDPAEDIAEGFGAYYRLGDAVSIVPVAIDGYDTPDTVPFALTGASNEQDIVYSVATDDGDTTLADDEELADTGASLFALLAGALGMVGAGATGLVRLKKQL